MLRPFFILFIVTTNLCTLLDSYKITNDKSSRTIEAYDQQDPSNLREEYVEENYSNEDSYKQSNGRVVIGKWRNNGEALEPKWRDGDSVPLAPFSTISFKSGWRRDPDSREEDYQIEPESFNENGKKDTDAYATDKNLDYLEPEESRISNKNADRLNSGISISTIGNYPPDHSHEDKQRIGYKNSHRIDRQFNRPAVNQENENSSKRNRAAVSKLSSSFRENTPRNDNVNKNIEGPGKYRETLQNYPSEYGLFENENDDPRPRKRRPPEHYEFPGTWSVDSNRREESYADDEEEIIVKSQSTNMANDVRRYLMTNQEPATKSTNQTKSQENLELKTFLKMQGNNLSLSEILQEKNLTLADLLKGKPNVINILRSNDKELEPVVEEDEPSLKESTFTERPERISTPENSRWSTRRRIMMKKSSRNSTTESENYPTDLNFNQTSLNFGTTTPSTINTNSKNIEETEHDIPLFNITKFINDNETVLPKKFDHLDLLDDMKNKSESREFLKTLENRESLLKEATTAVVEDGSKTSFNDRHASTSDDRFVPERNDDDDEIMEFSDYPVTKISKFGASMAILYETATLNAKRKTIPLSAIRTNNPVEDPDLKLNIEHILSPENKVSAIINETNTVNENSRKIINEIEVKNVSIININERNEESGHVNNEAEQIKLPDNTDANSEATEYENPANRNEREKISVEKDVKNDFIQDSKESIKSVDVINAGSNGYEKLAEDQENLTLNHKLHEVVIPKVDPESRAEILELFSSGSSAERLERLLSSRNMTIEELIALRQRGSSQVHFAEIFKAREQTSTSLPQNFQTNIKIPGYSEEFKKNQTSEITEKVDVLNGNNNSTNIENNTNSQGVRNSNGNEKNSETFERETKYSATDLLNRLSEDKNLRQNISTLDKTKSDFDTPVINRRMKSGTGIDLKKHIENSDVTTIQEQFSADNNIQRDSDGSSYYTSIEAVQLSVKDEEKKKIAGIFGEEKIAVIKSVSEEEIGRVEEILNNDLKSITNVYGTNDYKFSEKKALSKVKPSIIASGGILGVTIVVFLSIFIVCRIRQKKKFAYKNSFTKAVFHNPVMTVRKLSNTSSINTIMVDVVATSTTKRPQKHETYESDEFEEKSDIDNDSLDANDSWDTIPDFMK